MKSKSSLLACIAVSILVNACGKRQINGSCAVLSTSTQVNIDKKFDEFKPLIGIGGILEVATISDPSFLSSDAKITETKTGTVQCGSRFEFLPGGSISVWSHSDCLSNLHTVTEVQAHLYFDGGWIRIPLDSLDSSLDKSATSWPSQVVKILASQTAESQIKYKLYKELFAPLEIEPIPGSPQSKECLAHLERSIQPNTEKKTLCVGYEFSRVMTFKIKDDFYSKRKSFFSDLEKSYIQSRSASSPLVNLLGEWRQTLELAYEPTKELIAYNVSRLENICTEATNQEKNEYCSIFRQVKEKLKSEYTESVKFKDVRSTQFKKLDGLYQNILSLKEQLTFQGNFVVNDLVADSSTPLHMYLKIPSTGIHPLTSTMALVVADTGLNFEFDYSKNKSLTSPLFFGTYVGIGTDALPFLAVDPRLKNESTSASVTPLPSRSIKTDVQASSAGGSSSQPNQVDSNKASGVKNTTDSKTLPSRPDGC